MGISEQGAKPSGMLGRVIGRLMNRLQTSLYIDFIKRDMPEKGSAILDVGCGGGRFIKYMARKDSSYRITGIDHSKEMAGLSERVNRRGIENGQVMILQSGVSDTKLGDQTYDLITAFETVQFWPDTVGSFREVWRLLKNRGSFLIINRYPEEETKWWERAKIRSAEEYIYKLGDAGFRNIITDLDFRKGWIIVEALK